MKEEEEVIKEFDIGWNIPFLFGKFQCPNCKVRYTECQSNKKIKSGEIKHDSTKIILVDDDSKLKSSKQKFICPSCKYEFIMNYEFCIA